MTYTKRTAQENREMDARALELFAQNGFDVNKAGLDRYRQYDRYTVYHRDRVIEQLLDDPRFVGVPIARVRSRVTRALRILWGKRGKQ